MTAPNVSINWQVKEMHYREQSVVEWAQMLPGAHIDPDGTPEDCADAINDWLESEVSADEVLIDLARPSTWQGSDADRDDAEADVARET